MYEVFDRQDDAVELIRHVVELNPDNVNAKTRLRRMEAGEITTILPEPIQAGQEGVTSVDEGEVTEEASAEEVSAEGETTE